MKDLNPEGRGSLTLSLRGSKGGRRRRTPGGGERFHQSRILRGTANSPSRGTGTGLQPPGGSNQTHHR